MESDCVHERLQCRMNYVTKKVITLNMMQCNEILISYLGKDKLATLQNHSTR